MAEAISGWNSSMTENRSSVLIPFAPPVVMPMTASDPRFTSDRICRNVLKSPTGIPSSRRAWICTTAAPAFAASMACCEICSGLAGKYGDMDGV